MIHEHEQNREQAEAHYRNTLRLVPDYQDAKEGLERLTRAASPEPDASQDAAPTYTAWQEVMIKRAECAEARQEYVPASRDWYCLYQDDPCNPHFTYRLAQVLGRMSRPEQALFFLDKTLALEEGDTDALLLKGYQEMASGNYTAAECDFHRVIGTDGARSDALDGLTRSLFLQGRYCEAEKTALQRFANEAPDDFIYKLYNRILQKTHWGTRGLVLYSQEREQDLVSKVLTTQHNTFVGSFSATLPITDRFSITPSITGGTTRERNLVSKTNNLFVPETLVNCAADWQICSNLNVTGGIGVRHAEDSGTPNFRMGHRSRVLPLGSISYYDVNQAYTFTANIDTLIVKLFGTGRSTLMPRDTYRLEGEWELLQHRITLNSENFLRYYHDVLDNRQYDCKLWAQTGWPRFNPYCLVRYTARIGGFKQHRSDYPSYSKEWENKVSCFFKRETVLNTDIELAYHRSWQWDRNLSQPLNTSIFVDKLFRGANKVTLELKQVYRPNIKWIFSSAAYWDSTHYTAWDTKGSLNLNF